MKYNVDCVRDVLLCLERELIFIKVDEYVYENKDIRISDLFQILGNDYI